MEQLAVVGIDGGTPPTQSQYLTFRLGEEEYAVPILAVHEIKGQSAITPLPNAPPCIPGVMNLRGTIVPVVDLRTKFGLPEVEHSRFTVIVLVVVGTKRTITVKRLCSTSGSPNFVRRSTTGTMVPRRFMTPGMQGGALGRGVIANCPLISCTARMGTAYSSSPSRNVRYWLCVGGVPP